MKHSPALVLLTLVCGPLLAGCQPAVMLGRIVFGDPQVPPALEVATGVRIEKLDEPIHVCCTAPTSVTAGYDALPLDLPDELSRRLRRRQIPVTSADDIADAIDDLGGRFDAEAIAASFDGGYLVHIDIDQFSTYEGGTKDFYRGRANGRVTVYEVRGNGRSEDDVTSSADEELPVDQAEVLEIFHRELRVEYPGNNPIPTDRTPEKVFRTRFVGHLADEVGRMLYRYSITDTF